MLEILPGATPLAIFWPYPPPPGALVGVSNPSTAPTTDQMLKLYLQAVFPNAGLSGCLRVVGQSGVPHKSRS